MSFIYTEDDCSNACEELDDDARSNCRVHQLDEVVEVEAVLDGGDAEARLEAAVVAAELQVDHLRENKSCQLSNVTQTAFTSMSWTVTWCAQSPMMGKKRTKAKALRHTATTGTRHPAIPS